MSSAATETFDLPVAPEAAADAVRRVIAEGKHKPGEESADGRQIAFVTKKTMLSWELDAQVDIAPTGNGSQVVLNVDTVAGRPKALLDGKKNRKSAAKLAEQIQAAGRQA
jgi:hypothetical protein